MTEPAHKDGLGQLLVQEGRLSPASLERALEAQRLVGGRLGTNLLELGLISEAPLLDALGRHRSSCTAGRAELARISPAVLRAVPEKLAKRYRLVPYAVRGKTLYVASLDPGDLLWEDEITFLTNFMVRTCVALEMHVMMALRQYYRIPVNRRFLALAKRLKSGATAPSAAPPPAAASGRATSSRPVAPRPSKPPPPSTPAYPVPTAPGQAGQRSGPPVEPGNVEPGTAEPAVEFIELDADDLALLRGGEGGAVQAPAADPAAAAGAPALQDPVGAAVEPAIERSGVEGPTGDGLAGDDGVEDPAVEAPGDAGFSIDAGDDSETILAKSALALQQADIRDEIGDVLLATSGAFFDRSLLLIARRGRIVGWRGAGRGVEEQHVRELDLDAAAPSIFAGLRDADSFWLGPLPSLPANRRLTEALGAPAPKDCLALPIVLRSKVVAHLYCDNLDRGVGGAPLADMKRLSAKAGLAFEVYILKNKIRMV